MAEVIAIKVVEVGVRGGGEDVGRVEHPALPVELGAPADRVGDQVVFHRHRDDGLVVGFQDGGHGEAGRLVGLGGSDDHHGVSGFDRDEGGAVGSEHHSPVFSGVAQRCGVAAVRPPSRPAPPIEDLHGDERHEPGDDDGDGGDGAPPQAGRWCSVGVVGRIRPRRVPVVERQPTPRLEMDVDR